MNKVRIISVPYDRGPRGKGMGAGPAYLMNHGLLDHLISSNPELSFDHVEVSLADFPSNDLESVLKINRSVKEEVSLAFKENCFPLILGNCLTSLGVVAAISSTEDLKVLWLDAHGDLNTPDTSKSGVFEGMSLALLTGLFGRKMWSQLSNEPTIVHDNVTHVGARDLDPGEIDVFKNTTMLSVSFQEMRDGIKTGMNPDALFQERLSGNHPVFIHLDVDALELEYSSDSVNPGNDGLNVNDVIYILNSISETEVKALSINPIDPRQESKTAAAQTVRIFIDSALKQISF